jgi:hypothetical protein
MNALAGGPMSRGDVVTRSALSCSRSTTTMMKATGYCYEC